MPDGLAKRLRNEVRILTQPEKPGPSYPVLPDIDEATGETRRPGLYILGEAAGEPLLKVALNRGFEWIERVKTEAEQLRNKSGQDYDVIIVGCGATGFAAANKAHEEGLSYLVLDSGKFCNLIESFTKGKVLFNEPHSMPQKGTIWFEESTKEELLERWWEHAKSIDLNLNEYEAVEDITGRKGQFEVHTTKAKYSAALVLVAIGKSGNPRKAGVPGESENAQRIHHFLADPDVFSQQDIVIYGGGDVAAEASLALCDTNKVTLVTIDKSFVFPKKRNIDLMLSKQKEGKLDIHFDTRLKAINSDSVELEHQTSGDESKLAADTVFEMIGSVPPVGFFRKIGVGIANAWTGNKWIALLVSVISLAGLSWWTWDIGTQGGATAGWIGGLVFIGALATLVYLGTKRNRFAWLGFTLILSYVIYAAKGSTPHYPFHWIGAERIAEFLGTGFLGWFVPKAVIALKGAPSFWYSLLYTFLVVFFGIRAMRRWGTAYDDKYQRNRYITIMAFQLDLLHHRQHGTVSRNRPVLLARVGAVSAVSIVL